MIIDPSSSSISGTEKRITIVASFGLWVYLSFAKVETFDSDS